MASVTAPRYEHVRRNFIMFLLDYVIFSSAMALIGNSTLVPDFVSRLTTDPHIIGLSGSIWAFFWLFPQLFMSQMINRVPRRSLILRRFAFPLRVFIPIFAVLLFVTNNPTVILIAFLVLYALFATGDGLLTIAWADLLGSTLPNRVRSNLYMIGQLAVALAVLGSRELIHRLLGPDGPAFPHNFAYLFAGCGAMFLLAAFFLVSIKDEKHSDTHAPGPTMREFLPFLGTILRTDKQFRNFARTRVLYDLSTMAIPFYIIFGERELHLDSATAVGNSILALTIGNAIGSLLFGWFSHKSGSRAVIRVAGAAILLHPLLALSSATLGVPALYAAFLLLGIAGPSTMTGFFDWIITYAPEDRRPIYLGLTNTISAISNLAPALGGVVLGFLLSAFATDSAYAILFVIAAVMAVAGIVSSLSLIEPQHKAVEPEIEIAPSGEPVEIVNG